jgi:putative adhesin
MRRIAIGLFTVALSLTAARADDWSKTYTVGSGTQLRVDTSDADIRLDTWDQNKIEAHVTTEHWKIGEDGIKIIERQTGDAVEIEVRFPHHNFVFDVGRRRVLVEIHMPREGRVALRTGDGRISVNRLKGDMDFYSGDGRLDIDDVEGNVRAHTGDGAIRVAGRFDSVSVTSGDGHVSLMARAGSQVAHSWDVRTSDGSVNLEIPADLAADVDLHTGDGRITLNVPLTVEGKFNNQDVHGKLNGGGNRLVVHTGDGSITVDKS